MSSELWGSVIWSRTTAPNMMPCINKANMLLQNIHNHLCTRLYGALIHTTLRILTTVSTSKPIPNIIDWSVHGNTALGKVKNRINVFFYTVFFITFFFHHMSTLFYITSQKTNQTNHFQHKYIFYNQDNIWWFQWHTK